MRESILTPVNSVCESIEGDELPDEFSVGPKPGKPLSPRQIGTMASVTKGAMEMSVEEDGDAAARDAAVRGGSGGGSSIHHARRTQAGMLGTQDMKGWQWSDACAYA